jgi:UMF1 family MFS transporter
MIEYWFLAGWSPSCKAAPGPQPQPVRQHVTRFQERRVFGLFGVMEKFSAILGQLVFAWTAQNFGSSRPAVLSIIAFFLVGGFLLMRVNVAAGQRAARQEDARLLAAPASAADERSG